MLTESKIDLEYIINAKLPPLPGSIMRISALLQDFNVSQKTIADAIGCDPMLASRVLRLANSPIYGFQEQITSLSSAVNCLGNKAIYEMVLMGMIGDSFGNEIRNSRIGRDNWLHSLATAFTARELAQMLEMRGTEEAFSCGLLHDIGSLLFFRAAPVQYMEIFNQGNRDNLTPLERDVFGFDHAEVGALAAHRWHLSEPVCSMILYHHELNYRGQGFFITNLINVSDKLSYIKNERLEIDQNFLDLPSVRTLNLTEQHLESAWEKVVANLREVIGVFFK